jgi:ATP synthase F1 complex assembly factor 1
VQDDSGESKKAYEFYFLQWAFHMAPPIPSQTSDFEPLSRLINEGSTENPSISTILFTPLQEYKLRTTFAIPYLVLTNYTDFVKTHGIVLLRGEITPSAAAQNMDTSGSDFLLSQQDAQLMAMQLQNFYLWMGEGNGNKEREHLLETFHENPQEFKWENLLKYAHPV